MKPHSDMKIHDISCWLSCTDQVSGLLFSLQGTAVFAHLSDFLMLKLVRHSTVGHTWKFLIQCPGLGRPESASLWRIP